MTTLHEITQTLSAHGVDPARVSQDPGDAAYVLTSAAGRTARFAPVDTDGGPAGWSYTVLDADGAQIGAGHSDSPAAESLLPVLHPLLRTGPAAATQAQLDTLTVLADPGEHQPTPLHPDSPTGRWILGLFVTWTALQNDDHDGSIGGADLVPAVAAAFAAIGLTDDITVDELAVRIDPTGRAGRPGADEHPAAGLLESHLDRTQGPSGANAELARDLVEVLRLDGQLVSYRRPGYRFGGPDNEDRAGWAEAALDAVCARTGEARACYRDPEALTQVASDLVANLLHLADRAGVDPELVVLAGMDRHGEESRVDHDQRSCSIPGCTRCDPAQPG